MHSTPFSDTAVRPERSDATASPSFPIALRSTHASDPYARVARWVPLAVPLGAAFLSVCILAVLSLS